MLSVFWLTIHATLMAIGWLVLVPIGIYKASVGRQQYPENWVSTHQAYMLAAAAFIIPGAIVGVITCETHFNKPHKILGPLLNLGFVVVLTAGLLAHYYFYNPHRTNRPLLNKIHRAVAPFLYLTSLVTVAFGIYDYSNNLQSIFWRNILVGTFLLYILLVGYWAYLVMPAWWKNFDVNREQPIPSST